MTAGAASAYQVSGGTSHVGASTLHQLFSLAAADHRERVAIVGDGVNVGYDRLESRSNRLAAVIADCGIGRGDRIGLFLPKSIDAVTAMLATNKVGACFIPFDTESPTRRLSAMLRSCEPALLITDDRHRNQLAGALPDSGRIPLALMDTDTGGEGFTRAPAFDRRSIDEASADPLDSNVGPTDLAYLLFTSGSTGAPKGVPIAHGSATAFVTWANDHFAVVAGDRQSGHSPFHFDLSIHDVFGTLLAGAELHLVPPTLNLLPTAIVDFIAERRLTQWFSVPSVLRAIAARDGLASRPLPSLRRLLWCGEVLPTPVLRYWMARLPDVEFTNLYGPTETTIASSYYTVPSCPSDDTESVPIGQACDGESLHVLDDDLRPADTDATGQLYISGVGLSPGYWGDEQKTAAAFVASHHLPSIDRLYRTGDLARIDDAGQVHFLGRADRQIKSRGYRIELDEIGAALASMPELKHSAVVAIDSSGFEGTTICAAYVLLPGTEATAASLRTKLTEALPTYMLPARWLSVEQMPSTPNGKTDHGAVARLFES